MAEKVSISKLCRGCMEILDNAESVCPKCGFSKSTYFDDKKKLRLDFILRGKYLVGKSLNSTSYENTYIGWDLSRDNKVVIKEFLPSVLAVREDSSTGNIIVNSEDAIAGFDKTVDDYINKARSIMADDGEIQVVDVFRENGTAYYVLFAGDGDDHYRLNAFSFVDAQVIDDIAKQARPKKAEKAFVQPARASVYGGVSVVPPSPSVNYGAEQQPYTGYRPVGNIAPHVIVDNAVEYRPETVLPSLAESNREAKEREREKELEKKLEKKLEETLQKEFEKRMEKQLEQRKVDNNSVFSFGPRTDVPSQVEESHATQNTVSQPRPVASGNPGTIQGDRRSAYTSIPPVSPVKRETQGVSSQGNSTHYSGTISVNGRIIDSSNPVKNDAPASSASNRKKLSEIRIAGKNLSTIAAMALCAVIVILVIVTLLSKGDDEKEKEVQASNTSTSNTATPVSTVEPEESEITFADAGFEAAVRKSLGITAETKLTYSYVSSVESLDLSKAGLTQIDDLAYFVGLKELKLSNNVLADINVLAQLNNLKRLDLTGCKVSDMSPLSGLSELEYVNVIGNKVADYTVLDNVKLVNGRYCKFYLTFVYHRDDSYDGFSLWSWHTATVGGEFPFTDAGDGTVTTTVEYYLPLTETGFKIKYKDWEEGLDVGYDRWVVFNQNRFEEEITIHLYGGKEEFKVVYSDGSTAEYGVRDADRNDEN
ncbi:MAG: hypothetical protein IJD02_04895 [Lachnospiraceae bacterium]|nr:hypothetical protein [Lachnospiraceae bacterium]